MRLSAYNWDHFKPIHPVEASILLKMRKFTMFMTVICVLFFVKLRWLKMFKAWVKVVCGLYE